MKITLPFITALITGAGAVGVSGAAEGFAKGVTGGGNAEAVYPKSTDELVSYLGDKSPRVIVLDKTYVWRLSLSERRMRDSHLIGSTLPALKTPLPVKAARRGEQTRAVKWPLTRTIGVPTISLMRLRLMFHSMSPEILPYVIVSLQSLLTPPGSDKAGLLGITVASDKTLIGTGKNGVIKGKGLRIVSGASNIIIQYGNPKVEAKNESERKTILMVTGTSRSPTSTPNMSGVEMPSRSTTAIWSGSTTSLYV